MPTPELNFEECSECKKKFHSNVELKVHMKLMHPKVDEFNCNICDKKFTRKWNLRSHLNFVHGVQENKGIFLNSQEHDEYLGTIHVLRNHKKGGQKMANIFFLF